MNQPNFTPLLDAAPTEVDRPKPLPVGTYLCVVQGLPRYDKSSKKQTEFTEFTLKPLQALDDVDQEALAEMGGLMDKTIKATYYHTEGAIWRLDQFHADCGLDLEEGVSRRERNEQVVGAQVLAVIKHEASEDGRAVFARLATTAKAE